MLRSMQMNHAIPRKAAADIEDGRSATSVAAAWLTSEVEVMVARLRKVGIDEVCNIYWEVKIAEVCEANQEQRKL
jgi:hypothetical protein